jgi:alkylation response protein AidB-like acyl-CoA dehydrogenase
VPTGSNRALANRPLVQRQVAQAEAALRSSRAFLLEAVDGAWTAAVAQGRLGADERANLRLAATSATQRSADAVDLVYSAGGGTAVYESCPLQRCFRDVHVATQHIMVAEPSWELLGRVRLGLTDGKGML